MSFFAQLADIDECDPKGNYPCGPSDTSKCINTNGHIGVAATVDIGMLMVVLTSTNAEKIYITVTGWRRVSTKTVLLIVTAVMDIAEMVPTVQVVAIWHLGESAINLTISTDINECSGGHDCHGAAICLNTPGSFTCQCSDGFTSVGERLGRNCAGMSTAPPRLLVDG
ncbi:hypothetical protein BSL78_23325 [Apostichopus japonicus]|uniref:EGF-like domain-containing protein n=1 Tax=Stichopus japonicus TaxID=307972 RepID=A0A2G8JVQ6_STIJA|nr:hypothetical protein BSL78_23325 [Apostichopus japonicus]